MQQDLHQSKYSVEQFVELESQIWDAFVTGDTEKDASLLSDDFIGEYPNGSLDKEGHYKQLEHGPMAESFEIENPEIKLLGDNEVELKYTAIWVRKGGDLKHPEVMEVWSTWKDFDGQWKNTRSKDVPIAS